LKINADTITFAADTGTFDEVQRRSPKLITKTCVIICGFKTDMRGLAWYIWGSS